MHQNRLKTAIFTANYNNGKFFEDYINSFINQSIKPDYIIYVDDASKDDSWNLVLEGVRKLNNLVSETYSKIETKISGITFVAIRRSKNGGPAAARNDAIRFIKDQVNILFQCDSDDYYRKDKIKDSLAIFLKYPSVGLIYSDYSVLNEKTKEFGRTFKESYSFNLLMRECCISTNCCFASKIVDMVGFYDEDPNLKYIEDFEFYKRAATVCAIHHIPKDLFVYRVHGLNGTVVTPLETLNERHSIMHKKFNNWINASKGK